MAFFKRSEESIKARKESKAFSNIVKNRELQARREAFAKEAVEQAKKKGKDLAIAKANKKSFGQRLAEGAGSVANRLTAPKQVARAPARRRTVRRAAPIKRRKVKRRSAPVRRRKVRRAAPVRQAAPKQQAQQSLPSIFDSYS